MLIMDKLRRNCAVPFLRPGRVNVKALVILVSVVVVVGVAAVAVRYVRKRVVAADALEAGLAAFEAGRWEEASRQFKIYLERRPTDETQNRHIEIPEKFAKSLLRIRPLTPENVLGGVNMYRRVLRLDPGRASTYEALARLYIDLRDFEELAYIARKRAEVAPDDPKVPIWRATVSIAQRKFPEAREVLEDLVGRLEGEGARHEEFVLACVMLSRVSDPNAGAGYTDEAAAWLDRAVAYDPESVTALVQRAAYYRRASAGRGPRAGMYQDRARRDLEAAGEAAGDDPQERLQVCREWLSLGDLDRALDEFESLERLDSGRLKEAFVSLKEWDVLRFLFKGEALFRLGQSERALALLDDVLPTLEHELYRERTLPLAVKIAARANRVERARDLFAEYRTLVIKREALAARNETVALLDAHVARAAGEPYRVISVLEPFLAEEVTDPALLTLLADAYRQTAQNRRALEVMQRYADQVGIVAEPEVVLALARERLMVGEQAEALRLLESLGPDNLDATVLRLEARLRTLAALPVPPNEETVAPLREEIARLADAHPEHVEAQKLRASMAVAFGDAEEAESVLRRALSEGDDPLSAGLMLVRLYVQTNRADEALGVTEQLCAQMPRSVEAWSAQADLQQMLGETDDARQSLEAALGHVNAKEGRRRLEVRLAGLELRSGARAQGVERLRALAASEPASVPACSLLLALPEVQSNADEASALIATLRKREGESGLQWRLHQATLWLQSDARDARLDEIESLLRYCVDADPGWAAAAVLLGRVQAYRGDVEGAEQTYRRALAANPMAVEVTEQLIRLLQSQGRFDAALRVMEGSRGGARVAAADRVRTLVGAGAVDRAIETLRLRVATDPQDADARVALAQLTYEQTRDAAAALRELDEAAAMTKETVGIAQLRAEILRDEGRADEAREVMDDLVARDGSTEARIARAVVLESLGATEAAEADLAYVAQQGEGPRGPLVLGMFYAERGRLDEAIAAWEAGLESYPNDAEMQRRLVMALLSRGEGSDRERGLEMLSALEASRPDDPDLLWIRALLVLEAGDAAAVREARQLLERVVALRPTAVNAHLRLIEMAQDGGDLEEARVLAVRALGANPENPRVLMARARVEQALGNTDAAATLIGMIVKADPENVEALETLTRFAVAGRTPKQLDEAEQAWQAAQDSGVEEVRVLAGLALLAEARGQSARAASLLEEVRADASDGALTRLLLSLAEVHARRGEAQQVEERLREAAGLSPQDPAVLDFRLRWLGEKGAYGRIAELTEGARPDPPFTPELLQLAAVLLANSGEAAHRDQARGLYEASLEDIASGSAAWFDAVGGLYGLGEIERVKALYRGLLAENPESTRALNDLAWILAQHDQDFETALELANRGLTIAPDDLNLLDTRGVILSRMPNRLEDARFDFQRCAELQPAGSAGRAKALLQLAGVTALLEDRVATLRALREAEEIDRRLRVFGPQERAKLEALRTAAAETP